MAVFFFYTIDVKYRLVNGPCYYGGFLELLPILGSYDAAIAELSLLSTTPRYCRAPLIVTERGINLLEASVMSQSGFQIRGQSRHNCQIAQIGDYGGITRLQRASPDITRIRPSQAIR